MDIENDADVGGKDSFTHGHLYGQYLYRSRVGKRGGQKDVYEYRDIDEHFTCRDAMIARILSLKQKKHGRLPFDLIVFNGKYDYTFIQDITDDASRLTNGSRFIAGKLKNGIKIVDIGNHYKGTLESAMVNFNMESRFGVVKLPLTDETMEARNRFDTMATYHLAKEMKELYNAAGVDLKCTAPSNALLLFRTTFMPENFSVHREDDTLNKFERKGYFGGRSEMFIRGNCEIASYDVHSMYPSVMVEHEYPDPMSARHFVDGAESHWREYYYAPEQYLGIYTAKVRVPEMHIPVLPIRYVVDKAEKLVFPVGEFEGTWTSEELRYAESLGVEILECSEFIVYMKSIPIFKPYIDYCWNQRQIAIRNGDKPMAEFWKLMMNSLYGKFAEVRIGGGYFGKAEDADWDKINIVGKRIATEIIQGVEFVSIAADRLEMDASHTIPCLSVFVTSYARIKLAKAMLAAEAAGYHVCYTDTDSIKIASADLVTPPETDAIGSIIHDGADLGMFGHEPDSSGYYHFIGQKNYGRVTDGRFDFTKCKLKGIPYKFVKTMTGDLNDPESVVITGRGRQPISEKQAITRHDVPNRWPVMEKVSKGTGDKRIWDGQFSHPIRL